MRRILPRTGLVLRWAPLVWMLSLLGLLACRAPAQAPAPTRSPLQRLEQVYGTEAPDLPIVIAVHGLGDRPESFARLFASYPGSARVIIPAAPRPHGEGGSWFTVNLQDPSDPTRLASMEEAAEQLATLARELRERYPRAPAPILTGFSQGGLLSYLVAVRHPGLIRRAVPVSGWLPEPFWPRTAAPGAPPIRGLHGDEDKRIPLGPTRDAVAALSARGWDASLETFPGVGHSLSPEMRARLYELISE